MQSRTPYVLVAVLGCALLAVMFAPRQHLPVLERLATRVERTQTLTPQSREAILQLVERVRDTAGDPRQQGRRDTAVQRVTDAVNAREQVSVGRGIGGN